MWRWVADRVVPRRAVAWHTPQHKFRLSSLSRSQEVVMWVSQTK